MHKLIVAVLLLSAAGCTTRSSGDKHLNSAYKAYEAGDCQEAILQLSQAERDTRPRPYLQPEISLLRGQCLERQLLYPDAAQTYEYILARYPGSEYAYRAKARLETLRELGRYPGGAVTPLPAKP